MIIEIQSTHLLTKTQAYKNGVCIPVAASIKENAFLFFLPLFKGYTRTTNFLNSIFAHCKQSFI